MHGWQVPHSLSSGERSGVGPDAGALGKASRYPRPSTRDGRTPVWHDQAIDEPRGVSAAWSGEGPGRVQPDRARLQSPAGAEYRRVQRADGRGCGLKAACGPAFARSTGVITESHDVAPTISAKSPAWPARISWGHVWRLGSPALPPKPVFTRSERFLLHSSAAYMYWKLSRLAEVRF